MAHKDLCRALARIRLESGKACFRASVDLDTSKAGRVHMLPYGPAIVARDGRKFNVSNLKRVVSSTELPLLLDYEHESESMFGSTRAAGWIEGIEIEESGLWGVVEWTAQGKADVAGRVFRYLSPVIAINPETREIERLISCALTNKPALRLQLLQELRSSNTTACAENVVQSLVAQGLSRDAIETTRAEIEAKRAAAGTLDMAKVRQRLRTRGYSDQQIADAERYQAAQRGR